MKNRNQYFIKLLGLFIITLLTNKVCFSQDSTNVDSLYLSIAEIEYLNQIEIHTIDSVKINFKGKKVLFITVDLFIISKKDFFDSKVKSVWVIDLSEYGTKNSTGYDLMLTCSMKDLKWKVRRKVKKRIKEHERRIKQDLNK